MNKKILLAFLTIVLGVFILLSGCQTVSPEQVSSSFELKLVETSDLHGAIFPYDFINDSESATSLAQISTYVNELKSAENREVILLDNGDILQGQPVVYYYNFEDTGEEHIQVQVMNYLGYAAGTVGNHDIEAGHPVYDQLVKDMEFPWLAANAVDVKTGEPYFEPYTVIQKNGATIVVLGMITPGISVWLPEDIWEGIRFDDMIETARKWVPIIMEKEQPDLLIGLFHSGTDFTYGGGTREQTNNHNASVLVAELVPGFDIIFTGHDHNDTNTTANDPDGKEVLILGALNAGRTVAVATVNFIYDPETDSFNKEISGETVTIEGIAADTVFTETFQDAFNSVKEYVSKRIGNFTRTISTREAMFGDSPFVDLIHRIQLEITDADVSFAAPLSFDAEISEGEIYVRDMFNLYKYENLLYTMELTGEEIKAFLEFSYGGWMDTMTGPDDHLLSFKKDDSGNLVWNDRYNSYDLNTRYYNYDSAAGIDYIVDISKPAGERINIEDFSDGRSFNMDDTYLVALNSYRGTGGGYHLTRGAGLSTEEISARLKSSTIKDLRYYLMKWIEEQGTVTPEALGNWSVEPTEWWEAAMKRDYELIYPE